MSSPLPRSLRIAVLGNGRAVHSVSRSVAVATLGHRVRLVTLGPVLPVQGLETIQVRTRPLPGHPLAAVSALRGVLSDLRAFRPDLLHLHYAGGRLGSLATLSGLSPLVVTVMGGDVQEEQHDGGLSSWERRATHRVLERADALLVKSEALLAALDRWGHSTRDKAQVVRWGVDPTRFCREEEAGRELRARLGLSARDRVILSPRVLAPLYAVHLLVEALPRVLSRVPEAMLLLTEYNASPEYRERVLATAREAGVSNRVRLVGPIDQSDMPALLSLAEVSAMAPLSDGLPQSLFEAMACGTPVVLGRLASYREVVGDSEYAVLADREPEDLARALLELLEHREQARELAARALVRVREIAFLPSELQKVDAVYRHLLETAPRRASDGVAEWASRALDAVSLGLR